MLLRIQLLKRQTLSSNQLLHCYHSRYHHQPDLVFSQWCTRTQDKDTCVSGTQMAGAGADLPLLSKTIVKHSTSPLILLWRTATACAITSMWLPAEVNWVMSKKRKPSSVFDLQAEKQSCCIDIYMSTSRRGPAFLQCCLIPCKTTGYLVLGHQARGSNLCTPAQQTQIRAHI